MHPNTSLPSANQTAFTSSPKAEKLRITACYWTQRNSHGSSALLSPGFSVDGHLLNPGHTRFSILWFVINHLPYAQHIYTCRSTPWPCYQKLQFGKGEVGNSPENISLSGCAKPSWEVQDLQRRGRGFDPWSGNENTTCRVVQSNRKKKKKGKSL